PSGNLSMHNVLFANVAVAIDVQVGVAGEPSVTSDFVTSDAGLFCFFNSGTLGPFYLTNSILVGGFHYDMDEGLIGYVPELHTNAVAFPSNTTGFRTVGGGHYYLTNNSPYRDVGTTNVGTVILSEIRTKTTYPPIVYGSTNGYFTNSLNLSPQVQRDTDIPDLGYHYDPLDYLVGGMYVSNATITVNPGTAIGVYATNNFSYGLAISENAQFSSQGYADKLNHLVEYDLVQEQHA